VRVPRDHCPVEKATSKEPSITRSGHLITGADLIAISTRGFDTAAAVYGNVLGLPLSSAPAS
jgi:hypothetical protein